jgi:hypothetical protein
MDGPETQNPKPIDGSKTHYHITRMAQKQTATDGPRNTQSYNMDGPETQNPKPTDGPKTHHPITCMDQKLITQYQPMDQKHTQT